MERPDTALSTQPVGLAAIAMKAALEMESIAYEKCVTLEAALPEACILRGNPDYLQRIVSSLLENALKYEPAGGRVQLTLTQDKRRAQLSVQNFGSAIPAEDLPHVFDRFYRSDKSRKGESGSFGLGLAITKEMVEELGGRYPCPALRRTAPCFRSFSAGRQQKRSLRLRESSFVMRQGGWTVSAAPWWGRPSYTRSRGCTPFRFFVCGIPC